MTCVPQLTGHLGLSSRHPVQSQRRQPVQQSCNIDPRLSLVSSLKREREREPGIEVGLYCNCDVISQCGYKAAYNNHLDILPSFYKQFWGSIWKLQFTKKTHMWQDNHCHAVRRYIIFSPTQDTGGHLYIRTVRLWQACARSWVFDSQVIRS